VAGKKNTEILFVNEKWCKSCCASVDLDLQNYGIFPVGHPRVLTENFDYNIRGKKHFEK